MLRSCEILITKINEWQRTIFELEKTTDEFLKMDDNKLKLVISKKKAKVEKTQTHYFKKAYPLFLKQKPLFWPEKEILGNIVPPRQLNTDGGFMIKDGHLEGLSLPRTNYDFRLDLSHFARLKNFWAIPSLLRAFPRFPDSIQEIRMAVSVLDVTLADKKIELSQFDDLSNLLQLKSITIDNYRFKRFPRLPKSISQIAMKECEFDSFCDPVNLSSLSNLENIALEYCNTEDLKLSILPKSIKQIKISNSPHIKLSLDPIYNIDLSAHNQLISFESEGNKLYKLPNFPISIKQIKLGNNPGVLLLENLEHLINLTYIDLSGCDLIRIPRLSQSIESINLNLNTKIASSLDLTYLKNLKSFSMTDARLQELPKIPPSTLDFLNLRGNRFTKGAQEEIQKKYPSAAIFF